MVGRIVLRSALMTLCLASGAGCWMSAPDTPVIEAEDVRLDIARGDRFRAAGERGDVYDLAMEVSGDVNGWVTEVAVGMSRVVVELGRYPEDSTDGGWRVYGPHDDDRGRDGSWMARIKGDEDGSSYEVYVGRRGASPDAMARLIVGELAVDDLRREGSFTIDFDTIAEYADILDGARRDAHYGGAIAVHFSRTLGSSRKQVELLFDGFHYDDGIDDLDFDGERYLYRRGDQGEGEFHFATRGSFQAPGWSGPALERMVVDMRWDARAAGRARGMIIEADGRGDLRHGDVVLHECFDPDGGLTWRKLNEEYAVYEPGYNFGDERSCVFEADALELDE